MRYLVKIKKDNRHEYLKKRTRKGDSDFVYKSVQTPRLAKTFARLEEAVEWLNDCGFDEPALVTTKNTKMVINHEEILNLKSPPNEINWV